jgi:hypothetical protein
VRELPRKNIEGNFGQVIPVFARLLNYFVEFPPELGLRLYSRRTTMTDLVCSVCNKKVQGSPLVNKPVPSTDTAHKKCAGATVKAANLVKPQSSALIAEGKAKAADRKELTGRDHQGNHDSNTKNVVRGGAKGDRHDHGTTQSGKAGGRK